MLILLRLRQSGGGSFITFLVGCGGERMKEDILSVAKEMFDRGVRFWLIAEDDKKIIVWVCDGQNIVVKKSDSIED